MSQRPRFTTIDQYIAASVPEVRDVLKRIRSVVQEAIPEATEAISYQMPAFRQGKVFFYFAAFKKHIGIYPPVHGSAKLKQALQSFGNEKGNLKFPLAEPIPFDLIRDVALALAKERGK